MCPDSQNLADSHAVGGATLLRSETSRQFIEAAGNLCRRLSLPRSLGQIAGLLFLSDRALSLDEITSALQMSKASASTGTRQLAAWGVVRQVWVPGDRRDHFEFVADVSRLARQVYKDFLKPRISASSNRLERMLADLDAELSNRTLSKEEHRHLTSRISTLSRIQKKVQSVSPLIERLL